MVAPEEASIIVGAGTPGCAFANWLSADPKCRVLLFEADGVGSWPGAAGPPGCVQGGERPAGGGCL
ncbi:hypothetical protein CEW88_18330 [Alloyangia pacifica]|uniref:Glucose-methanol-choline oxidoreductase N-terminal domain-containing protein n=1 Tax=Alloyangia pacifica TaxID=311180 RepID=A0A2U8HIW6_9RHOB|nr:hypothetical protein CEW88_18330 [Alloyangia pacifica]